MYVGVWFEVIIEKLGIRDPIKRWLNSKKFQRNFELTQSLVNFWKPSFENSACEVNHIGRMLKHTCHLIFVAEPYYQMCIYLDKYPMKMNQNVNWQQKPSLCLRLGEPKSYPKKYLCLPIYWNTEKEWMPAKFHFISNQVIQSQIFGEMKKLWLVNDFQNYFSILTTVLNRAS